MEDTQKRLLKDIYTQNRKVAQIGSLELEAARANLKTLEDIQKYELEPVSQKPSTANTGYEDEWS